MPTIAFSQPSSNICCPRDAVSRTANVGTVGKNGLTVPTCAACSCCVSTHRLCSSGLCCAVLSVCWAWSDCAVLWIQETSCSRGESGAGIIEIIYIYNYFLKSDENISEFFFFNYINQTNGVGRWEMRNKRIVI